MKCDRCDKQAVFQASMFLNGESVQINLCEDHYEEMMEELADNFKFLSQGFIDSDKAQELYLGLLDALENMDDEEKQVNIFEGFTDDKYIMKYLEGTFKDMKKKSLSERLNEYKDYKDNIDKDDEIKNSLYYKDKLKEIKGLRSSMVFFINNEMYEEAARVRDELKEINDHLIAYRKSKEEKNEV